MARFNRRQGPPFCVDCGVGDHWTKEHDDVVAGRVSSAELALEDARQALERLESTGRAELEKLADDLYAGTARAWRWPGVVRAALSGRMMAPMTRLQGDILVGLAVLWTLVGLAAIIW